MLQRRTSLGSQAGMTLIEVLLVVFLIGLGASLAVMTLPAQTPADEARAEAIASEIKQTRLEAMLSGQALGIRLTPTHYETTRWLDEAWLLRDISEPFPTGVELVNDIDPSVRRGRNRDEEIPVIEGWPDIVFDPTGVVSETRFRLLGRDSDYDILISENGEVELAKF